MFAIAAKAGLGVTASEVAQLASGETISLMSGQDTQFVTGRQGGALAAALLLLPLGGLGQRKSVGFLQWVAAHGTYTLCLLLLSSPLGIGALRERLPCHLNAQVSEGIEVLLRVFYPRIFKSLLTVFETLQRERFLSPADSGAASRTSFLRRHMAAAEVPGIVATHEVALYCGLAVMYGDDFAQRPAGRPC